MGIENNNNNNKVGWIEHLLQTPIVDCRKYCIWRILVPYLINRKHVSQEERIHTIKTWLDQCSNLEQIKFNVNQKINDTIIHVGNYGPVYPDKLKEECPQLYDILVESRVL